MARLGDLAARRSYFYLFTGGMRNDDFAQRGGGEMGWHGLVWWCGSAVIWSDVGEEWIFVLLVVG